jgi:hypothetical protein
VAGGVWGGVARGVPRAGQGGVEQSALAGGHGGEQRVAGDEAQQRELVRALVAGCGVHAYSFGAVRPVPMPLRATAVPMSAGSSAA